MGDAEGCCPSIPTEVIPWVVVSFIFVGVPVLACLCYCLGQVVMFTLYATLFAWGGCLRAQEAVSEAASERKRRRETTGRAARLRLVVLEEADAERKKVAEARGEAEKVAAVRAGEAAALGLLQPLMALTLELDTLHQVTAAAVAYCDAQGAATFADLVGRASRLIAHPQAVLECSRGPDAVACDALRGGVMVPQVLRC